VVRFDVIGTLLFGQEVDKLIEAVREQHSCTTWHKGPLQFEVSNGKNAAKNQTAYTLGMLLRVCESQRRAPRAAKDKVPLWDIQVFAESFDIGNQMPGRVVVGASIWTRLSAAALIKQDYAIMLWVEELRVCLSTLTSRAAM
jgi:hypothetical protein